MLQDNIAMATKTINSVQRLLGDSVALVKSKQIVSTKLNHVLQMDSHLHTDDEQPIRCGLNHMRSCDPPHIVMQLPDEPISLD